MKTHRGDPTFANKRVVKASSARAAPVKKSGTKRAGQACIAFHRLRFLAQPVDRRKIDTRPPFQPPRVRMSSCLFFTELCWSRTQRTSGEPSCKITTNYVYPAQSRVTRERVYAIRNDSRLFPTKRSLHVRETESLRTKRPTISRSHAASFFFHAPSSLFSPWLDFEKLKGISRASLFSSPAHERARARARESGRRSSFSRLANENNENNKRAGFKIMALETARVLRSAVWKISFEIMDAYGGVDKFI